MRRRTVVIALAVVVVVGVVVGGLAWVRGQDYLEPGSTSRVPADARIVRNDDAAPGEAEETALIPYRDGAQLVYGLSVRNRGPFSVKVTEVARPEAPGESNFLFRVVDVRMATREFAGTDARVPFRPFALGRGEERYVEVIGRLGDCEFWMRRSSETIPRQSVRFDVLGQSLTEAVPLDPQVEVRRGARCPRFASGPAG
jgi:hypothetical protein